MAVSSLSDLPDDSVIDADVAIVGGGAAGITLAVELQGSGRRVVLLEGGGREPTTASQARYEGPLTVGDGMAYPALDVLRLRHLGGTTNHWAGWCRPLEPNVFGERPGTPGAWPFPRDQLDAAYARAHEICRLGRFEYDMESLLGDGGHPARVTATDVLRLSAFRFSPPVRFGEAFWETLRTGDTETYLDANCVGIDVAGDRVHAVRLRDGAGRSHTARAGIVVLACGGIEAVRQLLLLRDGGVESLDRSGTLGLGFMEHPHLGSAGWLLVEPGSLGGEGEPWLDRALDVDGTPFRAAFTLDPSVLDDESMVNVSYTLHDLSGMEPSALPFGRAVASLHAARRGTAPEVVGLFARTEMRPGPESRIRLVADVDDLGVRRAGLDLRFTAADRRDLERGRSLVVRELMAQGVAAALLGGADDSEVLSGGGHHLGGSPMHVDPDLGVVDADLRCHALENLYVASGAVFPTSCFSNPTLTIVALAVRLADRLRDAP